MYNVIIYCTNEASKCTKLFIILLRVSTLQGAFTLLQLCVCVSIWPKTTNPRLLDKSQPAFMKIIFLFLCVICVVWTVFVFSPFPPAFAVIVLFWLMVPVLDFIPSDRQFQAVDMGTTRHGHCINELIS